LAIAKGGPVRQHENLNKYGKNISLATRNVSDQTGISIQSSDWNKYQFSVQLVIY